ncbi:MAG: hypothetical protein FWE05_13645 [Defluviitaleaceae bacterium]|nr:hypothetical protein [Defluviitaleaceae bacterium]
MSQLYVDKTPQDVKNLEVNCTESGKLEMKFSSVVITCTSNGEETVTSLLVDGKELGNGCDGLTFMHYPNSKKNKVSLTIDTKVNLFPAE